MSSGDERESDKWMRIVDEKTLLNISSVVPELLELRRTSIASRLQTSEENDLEQSPAEASETKITKAKKFLKEVLNNMDQTLSYEERKFKSLTERIETLDKYKSKIPTCLEEREELPRDTLHDLEIKLVAHKELYKRMRTTFHHVLDVMYGDGEMIDLLQELYQSYSRNVTAYIEARPSHAAQVAFLFDNELIEMNPTNLKEIRFANVFD